jgi:hypothetical protein
MRSGDACSSVDTYFSHHLQDNALNAMDIDPHSPTQSSSGDSLSLPGDVSADEPTSTSAGSGAVGSAGAPAPPDVQENIAAPLDEIMVVVSLNDLYDEALDDSSAAEKRRERVYFRQLETSRPPTWCLTGTWIHPAVCVQ